jgi:cytochrome c-type biogenesis protein CcmH/NrfG
MELDLQALSIRTSRLGPNHPDLAFNLTGLGEARVRSGNRAGALEVLEKALILRPEPGEARGSTAYWLSLALTPPKGKKVEPRARGLMEEAAAQLPASTPLGVEARNALRQH